MKRTLLAMALMFCSTACFATVPTDTSRLTTIYACDGSDTTFTWTFGLTDDDDLQVILITDATGAETTLTKTTHYTLASANGNDPQDWSQGGTVTTVATYSSDYSIMLRSNVPRTQLTSLDDEEVEEALDKLSFIAADIYEILSRCLKIQPSESGDTVQFGPDGTAGYAYRAANGNWSTATPTTGTQAVAAPWDSVIAGTADDTESWQVRYALDLERAWTTNVLDYGAVGDGVTDDTAAIQAAINATAAVGGGIVLAPYGVYRTSEGLSFEGKHNVVLWGAPGAKIKADPGSYAIIYIGDDSSADITYGVTIRGLTLEGDKTDTQPWEARSGTTNGGIRIFAGRRIRIYDVNFVDIYASGIDIDDSSNGDPCDIVIAWCSFYNIGYHGIGMSECSGVAVSDCYMERIGHMETGPTYHGMGIDFSTNSTNCRASNIQITRANYGGKSEGTNCSVFNLTATELADDGIVLAGHGHRWTNCRFSWRDANRATACRPVSGGGYDNTITACEFDDTYYELDIDGDGISLIGCLIRQNADATSAYYGMRIEDGSYAKVVDCNFVCNRTTSGVIYNNAPMTSISNNTIVTTTGAAAIAHGSLATDTIVTGNYMAATTYAQDYHASSTGVTAANRSSQPDDVAGTWTGFFPDRVAIVDLTNAQIKDLADTAVELVAAPGSGKWLEFLGASLWLDYGSNALTEPSSPDNLRIAYVNKSGAPASADIAANGFVTATADTGAYAIAVSVAGTAASSLTNKALVLCNTGEDYAGNAGNDTVMRVIVHYRVHSALGL